MDQELIEYLDHKFTRVEDKLDLCASREDVDHLKTQVTTLDGRVTAHGYIFKSLGAVSIAGIGAWFQHWFGKH